MRAWYWEPYTLKNTVNIYPKKYFDCETGKFIRDKLDKIVSYCLGDIIDDYKHNNIHYNWNGLPINGNEEVSGKIYNFPKFIPKDNDFDLELEFEKKQREKIIINNELEKRRLAEIDYAERRLAAHLKEQEQQKEKERLAEIEYQEKVKMTEIRLQLQRQNYLDSINNSKNKVNIINVIRNKWNPK